MLTGQDIKIRTIREQDLDSLVILLNDIESLGEFLPTSMVSEVALRREFHENGFQSETASRFIITDHSDKILGSVWAFKSVPYFDAVEIGYHIFDMNNRGKGLASEAIAMLTDYIFESRQTNRVEIRVSTENVASEKVAKKVGFIHEGTNREAAFSKGKLFDMHIYAMLRRDWQLTSASR